MTPVQLPEVPEWSGDFMTESEFREAAQAYAIEYGDAILAKIRTAVADYMSSEGCSCCRGNDHDEHKAVIAGLLGVAPYSDNSGFDFAPYRTGATQPEQNSGR